MLPLLEEAEATLGNDELEIEKRPAPVREWLVTGWGAAK